MRKEDWIQWRNNPVSEEYLESVINEMDNHITDLVRSAGDNPLTDKFRRGVIEGLRFLADWRPDFEQEVQEGESEDDDDSSGAQASY